MEHAYNLCYKSVYIRPFAHSEVESLRIMRNTHRKWFKNCDEITQEAQEAWFQKYRTAPEDYMFSVERVQDGKFIGVGALYNFCRDKSEAEFGRLMIDRAAAGGPGYGLITTAAVCKLGFSQMALDRIWLQVYHNNIAAYKIYQRVGFVSVAHDTSGLVKMILTEKDFLKAIERD